MGAEINSIIDNLCEKFGTTTAYLIPEMAKYNIARDIEMVVFSIIFMIIAYVIWSTTMKRYKEALSRYDGLEEEYQKWHRRPCIDDYFGYFVCSVILFFAFICTMMISVHNLVGWIASPTAAFVNEIIHSIGG